MWIFKYPAKLMELNEIIPIYTELLNITLVDKVCNCDWISVLQKGCSCGAIKPYKGE